MRTSPSTLMIVGANSILNSTDFFDSLAPSGPSVIVAITWSGALSSFFIVFFECCDIDRHRSCPDIFDHGGCRPHRGLADLSSYDNISHLEFLNNDALEPMRRERIEDWQVGRMRPHRGGEILKQRQVRIII